MFSFQKDVGANLEQCKAVVVSVSVKKIVLLGFSENIFVWLRSGTRRSLYIQSTDNRPSQPPPPLQLVSLTDIMSGIIISGIINIKTFL